MKSNYRDIRPIEYFILTFLLSWLIWIPLDISHFGIGALDIPEGISNITRLLGVLMPAVAASILTWRNGSRQATRSLLSRLAPLINVLLFSLYHFFSPWQNVTRILALLPMVYAVAWKRNIYISIWVHCILNVAGMASLLSLLYR